MGARGPKRLPPEIAKARGSYRHDRHGMDSNPVPEPGKRHPPPWLDAEARRAWWDLLKRLDSMAVLAFVDYYVLAILCDTWSRWRKVREFLDKHGDSHVVFDASGKPKGVRLFPQVRLARELVDQLLRLFQQLAMTPASRNRAATISAETYGWMDTQLGKMSEEDKGNLYYPFNFDPDEFEKGAEEPAPAAEPAPEAAPEGAAPDAGEEGGTGP